MALALCFALCACEQDNQPQQTQTQPQKTAEEIAEEALRALLEQANIYKSLGLHYDSDLLRWSLEEVYLDALEDMEADEGNKMYAWTHISTGSVTGGDVFEEFNEILRVQGKSPCEMLKVCSFEIQGTSQGKQYTEIVKVYCTDIDNKYSVVLIELPA